MYSKAILVALTTLALTLIILNVSIVSAQQANLSPSIRSFDLVRGTKAENLPEVLYSGTYSAGVSGWTHCTVSVTYAGPVGGIQAVQVGDPVCTKTGDTSFRVEVKLRFIGTYTGGTFSYTPITSARVVLYNGTDTMSTIVFSTESISVSEVVVTSVSTRSPPVSPGSITYKIIPNNPSVGSLVYILPVGDINLAITLDRAPTVPPNFVFRAMVVSSTSSASVETTVDFQQGATSMDFTIAGAPLDASIQYELYQNNIYVYGGQLQLPVNVEDYGKAVFTAEPPTLVWKSRTYYVYGSVNVLELQSASLDIQLQANSASDSKSIRSPGRVSFELPQGENRPSSVQGQYVVTFKPSSGASHTVTISFSTSYMYTSGKFLSYVFYAIFNVMLGASLFTFFFGFFMRRADILGQSMLMLIFTALIFGVPTIMTHIISAVKATGLEDPIGIGEITVMNIGEKLDAAIQYIQDKGYYFSTLMLAGATSLVFVLGVLIGLAIGGGIAGIFTGGALSIFLGNVLGAFGQHIVSIIMLLYLGSIALSALTAVFPIFMNVIIMLILFVAILQAFFASVTNNVAPVVNSIISLSVVVMLVIMTPLVLATLDKLYYQLGLVQTISFGPVKFEIPLNPFAALAIAIIQIIFLVTVLAMSFHRLMTSMQGFGNI